MTTHKSDLAFTQWVRSPKSGHGDSHSSQQQRITPNFTSNSTFEPVSTFHFYLQWKHHAEWTTRTCNDHLHQDQALGVITLSMRGNTKLSWTRWRSPRPLHRQGSMCSQILLEPFVHVFRTCGVHSIISSRRLADLRRRLSLLHQPRLKILFEASSTRDGSHLVSIYLTIMMRCSRVIVFTVWRPRLLTRSQCAVSRCPIAFCFYRKWKLTFIRAFNLRQPSLMLQPGTRYWACMLF